MTSPDRRVPSGAYGGSTATGNNIANLQAVTWAGARDAVVASVMGAFSGVDTANTNLMGNARTALDAATTAGQSAGNAQQTAVDVQLTTASNASVVASMTASQEGLNYGGTVFTDIFDRAALQPGYNTFTTGQIAAPVIVNEQCALPKTGNQGSGHVVLLSKTTTQTDDQAVSVVMGSGGGWGSPETFLIARASVDLATFACAKVASGRVALGYGTRAGGITTFVEVRSMPAHVNTGDTVLFEAIGCDYTLFVNGQQILQWCGKSNMTPVGAANRSFGFGLSYTVGWFGGSRSFNAAGLTAVDMKAPPMVGTGWSLQMAAGAGVPAIVGTSLFPSNAFSSGSATSNNVTVLDRGAGRIQVLKAGWYAVNLKFQTSASQSGMCADIHTSPGPDLPLGPARRGALTAQAPSTSAGVTAVLYLTAGSVVVPGHHLPSATNLIAPTSFDGTLLSY